MFQKISVIMNHKRRIDTPCKMIGFWDIAMLGGNPPPLIRAGPVRRVGNWYEISFISKRGELSEIKSADHKESKKRIEIPKENERTGSKSYIWT